VCPKDPDTAEHGHGRRRTPSADLVDPNTTVRDAAIRMRDDDVGALRVGENDRLSGMVIDRNIWGLSKEYSQDQIGAVSLLARLELVGVDVGDRWVDLGQYLEARVDDQLQPFLSAQYL